ncbi:GNAT family N-acetyltransferase [Vibrio sp. S4M6]|uniref:GNAT family N-acetyltransferase n=1 Tax=Vibrio sinus TaxID=2946865 RepID=UPI00202AA071|nr:GNAT family N-acetyltransferase [Vibrio sinus]MCL9782771.1 GNAT family N-acetyltransferase [Vibrio sinus]
MAIVTNRTLIIPYSESLQSEFLLLNCCSTNRAEMNGPHTLASAKALFREMLHNTNIYSMAVLDNRSREYMGHIFVSNLDARPELGFIFDSAYWGKGIATESLSAFFPRVCEEKQLSNVVATANVDHYASIAVLNNLGFKRTGQRFDKYGPYYEYEFTRDVVVDEISMA